MSKLTPQQLHYVQYSNLPDHILARLLPINIVDVLEIRGSKMPRLKKPMPHYRKPVNGPLITLNGPLMTMDDWLKELPCGD